MLWMRWRHGERKGTGPGGRMRARWRSEKDSDAFVAAGSSTRSPARTADASIAPFMLELLREAVGDQLAEWRAECEELRAAFDAWSRAAPWARPRIYAEYQAALEREQRASDVLRDLLERSPNERRLATGKTRWLSPACMRGEPLSGAALLMPP